MAKRFFCLIFTFYLLVRDVLLSAVVAQSGLTQATTTLSEARYSLAATSSGELIFFGGGYNKTTYAPSARVDIGNVTSGIWTTATLSIPRGKLVAASSGNLIFFAGGSGTTYYNQVDIYNISDGSWNTATLSQARAYIAATSLGTLVFFAGGWNGKEDSNLVDIYNISDGSWNVMTLSQNRSLVAAASVENLVLFGGGYNFNVSSQRVDIFNVTVGSWMTASLSVARRDLVAVSSGRLVFFGGGYNGSADFNVVDIFDSISQTWSTATLSQARANLAATSVRDIVVFGGGTPDGFTASAVVDICNVTSNIWFTATLSQRRWLLAATSSTNKMFFGGGIGENLSNVVDIFCVYGPCPPNQQLLLGIVLGILAFLFLGSLLFIFLFLKTRRKMQKSKLKTEQELREMEVDSKYVTVGTQDESEVQRDAWKECFFTQTAMSRLQIPYKDLIIEKDIGEGGYGKVQLGRWNSAPVALKFCRTKTNTEEFMREVKLMVKLPPHPNVVQMYGVTLDGPQPIIVMEYCNGGSLDKLLFNSKSKISDDRRIELVRGIAIGMLHLHKHNIIHRDLAARNILLAANGVPKISDFGMSRILEKADEGKSNSNVGPVCWLAPESISSRNYSKKSDVWTFGIVIYEIVAQCEPHKDKNVFDVGVQIRDNGLTPEIPNDCPSLLRQLMEMCWNKQPDQRPTFEMICAMLDPYHPIGF